MILMIDVVNHKWVWNLKQSFKEYVLFTVSTSEDMSASKRTYMMNHFQIACFESQNESIRHFEVLSDSVLELLLEYVLRHLKSVLTYKYDENDNVKVVKIYNSASNNLIFSIANEEERRRRRWWRELNLDLLRIEMMLSLVDVVLKRAFHHLFQRER